MATASSSAEESAARPFSSIAMSGASSAFIAAWSRPFSASL